MYACNAGLGVFVVTVGRSSPDEVATRGLMHCPFLRRAPLVSGVVDEGEGEGEGVDERPCLVINLEIFACEMELYPC